MPDWQISGLQVKSSADGVSVLANSFYWSDAFFFTDINYQCPQQIPIYPLHQCHHATVSLGFQNETYQAKLDTNIDLQNNHWKIDLADLSESLLVSLSSDSQSAIIKFNQIQLNELIQMTKMVSPDISQPVAILKGSWLFDWQEMRLYSQGPILFDGLSYEYSDDIIVAELSGVFNLSLDLRQQQLEYSIAVSAGEMLFDQLYVDFSNYPVVLSGDITANDGDWINVNSTLQNQQSLKLTAQSGINKKLEFRRPSFKAEIIDSHHFNQNILNSVLGIYGFGGSEMSGQFYVSADSISDNFDQWRIQFNDYYLLNERRKTASEALNGNIYWHQDSQAADSNLKWEALLVAGLPIGRSKVLFNFSADNLKMLGNHNLPVFDGAIELKDFQLQKLFSEFIDMQIDATILPISLKLITEKMGWPIMSGSISGDIPGMVKQGSVIEFLGALKLKVFAGEMLVDNLSMERLFGVAPVIAGDVSFDGFDLSILTETFGFGLITGKLSGQVNELRITNWKTDRLDAQVYTVKTKGVKQVISQRAIENISSLGGIKGAISKTFLRFFDDFRYKKIKLSCKLHNTVCQIGGLRNQGNQFVIVEGGGIPKINIVGFVRSINWEEFINRLLNANYNN